jgi:CHAT domain-containing protein
MVRAAITERPNLRTDIAQPQVDRLRYSAIPPLPDTRDEVLALARSLGADVRNDVLLGRDATRESVLAASADGRLQRKRVVVFATHGLLAGDLPHLDQPALAMAAVPPSSSAAAVPLQASEPALSPLLTLEDVLGLKLNADWVVLSACNTAGADGRQGEAMSGLARGFFYAGSRSLLVTHWSVESESAKLLTTNTFAAYQSNPGMTRSRALRHGMLVVMALPRFEHPAFWAPYTLVGEGGR